MYFNMLQHDSINILLYGNGLIYKGATARKWLGNKSTKLNTCWKLYFLWDPCRGTRSQESHCCVGHLQSTSQSVEICNWKLVVRKSPVVTNIKKEAEDLLLGGITRQRLVKTWETSYFCNMRKVIFWCVDLETRILLLVTSCKLNYKLPGVKSLAREIQLGTGVPVRIN
jgi:hypothetical protein